MGSFQVFRAGAEALAESQLGIKAAATLSEAATTASKFLSEAYPSAKGMIAKAGDLFRSPQTASSLSLEGAGEMTAAERAATPGGKSYAEMLAAYEREKAIGFTGTRALVNETRTTANGFDALSRQVEKLQGIGVSSAGSELPRSLEGIRKSFQPVAANLELGAARSANLHNFVPGESSLANRIQPSTLRYPPIESQVVGTTTARAEGAKAVARAEGATAASRTEKATATVQEAESEIGATETTAKGSPRRRNSKVIKNATGEETAGREAGEATTSGRRASSRRASKAAETDEAGNAPVKPESAKAEPPLKPESTKAEPPVKPESAKAETPAKPETAKAEAPAAVEENATVAEVVEGEATGPAGQPLNRAARRKLERTARHDRRRGPSPQEQEAREYQRA